MNRRRAYLSASVVTVAAAVWAWWWIHTPGMRWWSLLPIAVVAVGAEAIRRTAPEHTPSLAADGDAPDADQHAGRHV